MHHIDTVFHSYNLSGDHAKDSFALGVYKWSCIITDAISEMPPAAVMARMRDILEEAWKETHIRCQLVELLAREATVGSEEENIARCRRLGTIIMKLGFTFLKRTQEVSGVRLIREIEKEYPGAEKLLTFIWTEQPYSPDPEDRFGWRDHTTGKGIPTVIYWPHDHAHLDTILGQDGLVTRALKSQEQSTEAFRSELLSGQQAEPDVVGDTLCDAELSQCLTGLTAMTSVFQTEELGSIPG